MPPRLRATVLFQRCLLDQPAAGRHDDVVAFLVKVADRQTFGDLFVLLQVQQIDDRAALAVACAIEASRRPFANAPCPAVVRNSR